MQVEPKLRLNLMEPNLRLNLVLVRTEPRMVEGLLGGDARLRIDVEEAVQQVPHRVIIACPLPSLPHHALRSEPVPNELDAAAACGVSREVAVGRWP